MLVFERLNNTKTQIHEYFRLILTFYLRKLQMFFEASKLITFCCLSLAITNHKRNVSENVIYHHIVPVSVDIRSLKKKVLIFLIFGL